MAYIINTYNTAQLTVVEDGTIDQTTDLKLVGKNYAGYGEIQNENFVFLLENFAGANEPPKAITGQVWFDSDSRKLKFYDGTLWRTTGGSEVASTAPVGLTEGDFWWDIENEQLYAFNGTTWILVGPQGTGSDVTQFQSRTIKDIDNINRSVIVSVVNDEVVHIISGNTFTIGNIDSADYPGFDKIHKGLTLKNTINSTNGVTSTEHRWHGTATNTDKLGGYNAEEYVRFTGAAFSNQVNFGDNGIAIGNSQDLRLRIVNDNQAIIGNEQGLDVFFQVKDSNNQVRMPFRITSSEILPGYDIAIDPTSTSFNAAAAGTRSVNIGSATNIFQNVYANNFVGLASQSSLVQVNYVNAQSVSSIGYYNGNTQATSGISIVARDLSGDINANVFRGVATSAKYADLAEYYLSDKNYEPGTVLVLGGDAEVTESNKDCDDTVAGVVSTNPAHLMNTELAGERVAVALKGRVPCKVKGIVNKGDLLVTSDLPGVARALTEEEKNNGKFYCVIGKSLSKNTSLSTALIEILV